LSWYEKFHNILNGTPKLTSVVGGIDQGSSLPHFQVVNLDDHPNSIPETQPLKNLEHQTLIFVDSNDHVTPNHTFDQAFDIMSLRTRACLEESPSIVETIKKYSQITKELELLVMQMTKEIMTQILGSE
jgi:hypothetical protein